MCVAAASGGVTVAVIPAGRGLLPLADDASRLGRRTEWLGGESDAVVGVGRRVYLLDGEQEIDMMGVESFRFEAANGLMP
jgi:protein involved in temperature-dependent protein secretion